MRFSHRLWYFGRAAGEAGPGRARLEQRSWVQGAMRAGGRDAGQRRTGERLLRVRTMGWRRCADAGDRGRRRWRSSAGPPALRSSGSGCARLGRSMRAMAPDGDPWGMTRPRPAALIIIAPSHLLNTIHHVQGKVRQSRRHRPEPPQGGPHPAHPGRAALRASPPPHPTSYAVLTNAP